MIVYIHNVIMIIECYIFEKYSILRLITCLQYILIEIIFSVEIIDVILSHQIYHNLMTEKLLLIKFQEKCKSVMIT